MIGLSSRARRRKFGRDAHAPLAFSAHTLSLRFRTSEIFGSEAELERLLPACASLIRIHARNPTEAALHANEPKIWTIVQIFGSSICDGCGSMMYVLEVAGGSRSV